MNQGDLVGGSGWSCLLHSSRTGKGQLRYGVMFQRKSKPNGVSFRITPQRTADQTRLIRPGHPPPTNCTRSREGILPSPISPPSLPVSLPSLPSPPFTPPVHPPPPQNIIISFSLPKPPFLPFALSTLCATSPSYAFAASALIPPSFVASQQSGSYSLFVKSSANSFISASLLQTLNGQGPQDNFLPWPAVTHRKFTLFNTHSISLPYPGISISQSSLPTLRIGT